MKAIKQYVKPRMSKTFANHRLTKYDIERLRFAVMLDNVGWPIHKIYHTGKMKTDLCYGVDERLDLSECAIKIFNKTHLEIAFMSNGTYIK